jgi:hypothetical protein|tara:strand:+ start:675 stop:1124 length:450 start_codon:yes stop_codon:yes gene_type:complete
MISNFSKIYRKYIVQEINVKEDDIVGLIEKIYIEDIGDVDAKIDSGNGAYNVINGEVVSKRGENIILKTIGGKKLKKKVVDHVVIHIGSGVKEDRPVVLFDIKLGDEEYKNVPFSVADRSENEYPVLIGKLFLSKIDKLIDVDKEYEQE